MFTLRKTKSYLRIIIKTPFLSEALASSTLSSFFSPVSFVRAVRLSFSALTSSCGLFGERLNRGIVTHFTEEQEQDNTA